MEKTWTHTTAFWQWGKVLWTISCKRKKTFCKIIS